MDNRALDLLKSTWPVLRIAMDIGNLKMENPAEAQASFVEKIEALGPEWTKLGLSAAESANTRYALCAFLDEAILARSSFGLSWLSHSLVMKYYQDFAAGETFFVKVDELKASGSVILPVFLLCLVLGFRGKYQFGDPKEFSDLVESLRDRCAPLIGSGHALAAFLDSGPGKLPKERSGKGWLIAAVVIGILSVSVYVVLVLQAQS